MKLIKSKCKLEIKSKINFYFIQCFGFSISTLFIIFNLSRTLLKYGYEVFNLKYFYSFFLFFLFLFLSIWFLFGFEKIIIDKKKGTIEIIRSNYIFTYKKLIFINEIKKIDCYKYKTNFFDYFRAYIRESQRSLFWNNMGRINIYTNGNKISILNGLNKLECKQAYEEINKMIAAPSNGYKE